MKIDIIIPAYHAEKTIRQALSSIAFQSIVEECHVTLVGDGDGYDYNEDLKFFDNIESTFIKLGHNVGCAQARQIGLNISSKKYIVFLDADDMFYHPFALETMLMAIESNPGCPLAAGNFVEIIRNPGLQMVKHKDNSVWLFGKIYGREYLVKHNIHFPSYNANEDAGFNGKLQLWMAMEGLNLVTIDDCLYTWNFNQSSITRKDNYEYTFNDSIIGYTINMSEVIKEIRDESEDYWNTKIILKIIEVMYNLYITYIQINSKKKDESKIITLSSDFYNNFYKGVEVMFDEDSITKQIVNQQYAKRDMIKDVIPSLNYFQFLDSIRSA